MSELSVKSLERARAVVPSFAQPRYLRFGSVVGLAEALDDVEVMLEFPVAVALVVVVIIVEAEVEVVDVVELMVIDVEDRFRLTLRRSVNRLMYAPSPPQYCLKSPLQRYWQ